MNHEFSHILVRCLSNAPCAAAHVNQDTCAHPDCGRRSNYLPRRTDEGRARATIRADAVITPIQIALSHSAAIVAPLPRCIFLVQLISDIRDINLYSQ